MSKDPEPAAVASADHVPDGSHGDDLGEVHVGRTRDVWTLTMSNPGRRNALTWRMYERLRAALTELRSMPVKMAPRVLVLRGEGNAFAAGTDIRQFRAFKTGQDGIEYEQQIIALFACLLAPLTALLVEETPALFPVPVPLAKLVLLLCPGLAVMQWCGDVVDGHC